MVSHPQPKEDGLWRRGNSCVSATTSICRLSDPSNSLIVSSIPWNRNVSHCRPRAGLPAQTLCWSRSPPVSLLAAPGQEHWHVSLCCRRNSSFFIRASYSSRLLQYCDSSAIFIFMFSYIMWIHHEGLKPYSLIFKMSWCPSYLRQYDSFCHYPSPWNHTKEDILFD